MNDFNLDDLIDCLDNVLGVFIRIICIIFLIAIITIVCVFVFRFVAKAQPIDGYADEVVECDEPEIAVSVSDAEIIAQILYHECRSLPKFEQSGVVWCILNRVDSEASYFPDSVYDVCTQKIGKYYMFAYREDAPIEEDLYLLAVDVLERWYREKRGETDVGRTLPSEYLYFFGDGKHNYFRVEYQGKQYWDWSLPNPYEEEQP